MKNPASSAPLPSNCAWIESRIVDRISVREWGLPLLQVPGKIWRSENNCTVTCMVETDTVNVVRLETLPLQVMAIGELSQIPNHWRESIWGYVKAYPASAYGLAPLLDITTEQRCDFVRQQAERLVASDNIGCLSIAHMIGQLASVGFEFPSGEKINA